MSWKPTDMPDQEGTVAVVTGSNSGIGFWTALRLAEAGAQVTLACRNLDKAAAARDRIVERIPTAKVDVGLLDLANLADVERFSTEFQANNNRLDLLINNAGIMIPPYGLTPQGHELQMGTNHLGHFALTGRLLPLMLTSPAPRVVTVSSTAHRIGRINFNDLHHSKRYVPWLAYGQSKLANLLFAYELDRRLASEHPTVMSTAAHPGFATTGITRESSWIPFFEPLFGQNADTGAWPTLRAATDPDAPRGSYWGPRWCFQLWGPPKLVGSSRASRNQATAEALWRASEELTGVQYLS